MNRGLGGRPGVLIALLASGLCVQARETWLHIEGPEATIVTDATKRDAVQFAVNYSAFRQAFVALLAPAGHSPPPHAQVTLFRHQEEFERYCGKDEDPKHHRIAFTAEADGDVLLALAVSGDRDSAMQTAFEFDTIWSLRRVGLILPLWMQEGAGEVFSTLRVVRGQCVLGADREDFPLVLQHEEWLAWPKFTRVTLSSPIYRGDRKTVIYFAQAWALMHWVLLDQPTGIHERFASLVDAVRDLPDADVATAAVMHCVPKRVLHEVYHHLGGGTTVRLPFDEASVQAKIRVTPASAVEVAVQLANLLQARGAGERADAELDRARALDPGSPLVYEARARRQLQQNNRDEAVRLYRAAIAAGSVDPIAFLQSAAERLDDVSVNGRDQPGSGGTPAVEAVAEIRKAIAIDPGDGQAYQLLGRALYVAPKITPAEVDDLAPGLRFEEQRHWVRYYEGLLQMRLGQTKPALAILRGLADDPQVPNPMRTDAREQVEWVDFAAVRGQVQALAAEHSFAEAASLVDRHDQPGLTRETQTQYQQLRSWLKVSAALSNLQELHNAGRWQDYHTAAQAFLRDFPNNPATGQVRALDQNLPAIGAGGGTTHP